MPVNAASPRNDAAGTPATDRKAYLIGSGIASLSLPRPYLIKEGGLEGRDITIFEEAEGYGRQPGCQGNPRTAIPLRGGRMFEEKFNCTYDLLSFIPSISNPAKTAKDELDGVSSGILLERQGPPGCRGCDCQCRGSRVSASGSLDLVELCATPETLLGTKTIEQWFKSDFFKSNFWFIWCTTLPSSSGTVQWNSSAIASRFTHLFSTIDTMAGIYRTQFNQYDAMVRPIVKWLSERGVSFEMNTEVMDIDVAIEGAEKRATHLHCSARRQGTRAGAGAE